MWWLRFIFPGAIAPSSSLKELKKSIREDQKKQEESLKEDHHADDNEDNKEGLGK